MSKQKAKQSASMAEKNEETKERKNPNEEKLADDNLEHVSGGAGLPADETDEDYRVCNLRGDHFV